MRVRGGEGTFFLSGREGDLFLAPVAGGGDLFLAPLRSGGDLLFSLEGGGGFALALTCIRNQDQQ